MSIEAIAIDAALSFIWLVLTAWTIVSLRTAVQQPDSRIVRAGVGFYGLTMWVGSTVIVSHALFDTSAKGSKWLTVLGVAFYLLPICLWVGYAWGRVMQAFMAGRRR